MQVQVLGPLRVHVDGVELPLPGRRARAVLLALLLHRGVSVPHDQLVDAVWADRPPSDVDNALQAQVSRLRRSLSGAADAIATTPGGYRIDLPPDAVDVDRFTALVDEGRRQSAQGEWEAAAGSLGDALALWRGQPAWAALDAAHAVAEVRRLEQLRAAAVRHRIEANLALGRHDEMLPELRAGIEVAPYDEHLHGLLMTALHRGGRQTEALRVFADLRDRMADELGLEPGAALQQVQADILSGDRQAGPAAPTPVRPAGHRPPRLDTSFIGRAQELERLRMALSASRLVTLVGPGGAGKTRLAIEAAAHLAGSAGDVCFAPLAAAGDDAAVQAAIASAVGATAEVATTAAVGAMPPRDRIEQAVRGRRILLIVDNCEHVIDAAARFVDDVLQVGSGVRVLATSREALRVPGERITTVSPLSVPPRSPRSPGATEPAEVEDNDAVRLFVDRARAVAAEFRLTAENAHAVAEICRRLDGLPLAVELAAARVAALPVDVLASRLGDRFRLLTGGSRVAARRQQTLAAVVDWSFDLLDRPQRGAFLRTGVFVGGFDLEAAEAVIADPSSGRQSQRTPEVKSADVLPLLTDLVGKSLLRAETGASVARWSQLETLRDFAQQRLAATDPQETGDVRERHARWFAAVAQRAAPRLQGPEQIEWLDRLSADHDNLLAALTWLSDSDPTGAAELAIDLAWFWWLRTHYTVGRERLAAAAAADVPPALRAVATIWAALHTVFAGETVDVDALRDALARLDAAEPRRRAEGHLAGAYVLLVSADMAGAAAQISAARHAGRTVQYPWALATADFLDANLRLLQGDPDAAASDAQRAATAARTLGDRWGEFQSTWLLAGLALVRGRYDDSDRLLDRADDLARDLGLRDQQLGVHAERGSVAMLRGDLDEAEALLGAVAAAADADGVRLGQVTAWNGLGDVARRRGDVAAAELAYRRVLQAADQPFIQAEAFAGLAFTAAMEGNGARSEALAQQALGFLSDGEGPGMSLPLVLEAAAAAALASGDAELAARRLGAAAGRRAAAGRPLVAGERHDVDRLTAAATDALGRQAFAAAHTKGAALPLEELLGG